MATPCVCGRCQGCVNAAQIRALNAQASLAQQAENELRMQGIRSWCDRMAHVDRVNDARREYIDRYCRGNEDIYWGRVAGSHAPHFNY